MIKLKGLLTEGSADLWDALEHWVNRQNPKSLTHFQTIDHIKEIAPLHGILIAPQDWIRIFSEFNRLDKNMVWDKQKQWFDNQLIKYNKKK